MAKKKKFNEAENPAMAFISKLDQEDPGEELSSVVRKPDPEPQPTEGRTKRLNAVITPSLYEACKEEAYKQRISLNEFFFRALEEKLERSR